MYNDVRWSTYCPPLDSLARCLMLMTGRFSGWQPAALAHIAAQPATASLIILRTNLVLHLELALHTQRLFPRSCSYMLQHDHASNWTSGEHASWLWSIYWVVAQEVFYTRCSVTKKRVWDMQGSMLQIFGMHMPWPHIWSGRQHFWPWHHLYQDFSTTHWTILWIFQPLGILTTLSERVQVKLPISRNCITYLTFNVYSGLACVTAHDM